VPKFRTAAEIATLALERAGVFPVSDTGPDPVQLSRALTRLDMVVAEKAGVLRNWMLVPATAVVPLTADLASFDLITQAGGAIPVDDFQFVVETKLRFSNGDDQDIERIGRYEYEALPRKDQSGVPQFLFIDRTPRRPVAYVEPVPAVAGFSLLVTYQRYAPDLTRKGGAVDIGLEPAWTRWAEYATAADIASGPVVRRPIAEVREWRAVAEAAWNKLEAFAGGNQTRRRRTRFFE
jgi:hypothetical protein